MPAKQQQGRSGGKNHDAAPGLSPPPQPPQQQQQQLDCWACDATVAVPLDPETGSPALAFSCGWCGAVTRVEEVEGGGGGSGGSGGNWNQRGSSHRKRRTRLSTPRRLLAKLLLPAASALSIVAATILGVGWVLPALFDESKHPWLLLLADALAALTSCNVAVHFAALFAQALATLSPSPRPSDPSISSSSKGPKRVIVTAAGVGRTPEEEDTVSVSFSGGDSGLAFSGGGGSVVSGGGGGGGANSAGGGGGGSAAAAVFVGSSVPRGAYAGHERCELCVEAAARASAERKRNKNSSSQSRSSRSGRDVLAASQQFFPFSSASVGIPPPLPPPPSSHPLPPPPPQRVSFSSWRKRGHRPPGAEHCLVCETCVADVDHHCSFVGTCVSLRAGKGGAEAEQEEAAELRSSRSSSSRHHPSGRHFALLLFWLLAGSLYATLGSVALLASRRSEVEVSWRRATAVLLLRDSPRRSAAAAAPLPQTAVRWQLGKPKKAPPPPTKPFPSSSSRRSRAATFLLVLFGIGPVLLVTSPPWMAAALGLAALSSAAGVGALFVAAEARRRVAAGESAADEKRRLRMRMNNSPAPSSSSSSLSFYEALSDLFGGGHPASWLLPPWGNDGDGDEKED